MSAVRLVSLHPGILFLGPLLQLDHMVIVALNLVGFAMQVFLQKPDLLGQMRRLCRLRCHFGGQGIM